MDPPSHLDDRPLILVVEDSRTQAALLRHLLQQNGCRVALAINGAEALEVARQRVPSLVISDILMPIMDGFTMCRAFKTDANPALRVVPIILLTSLQDPADIVRGLQVGADYYLTKPYDPPHLLETVNSILSQPNASFPLEAEAQAPLEIEVSGQSYSIAAGRRQMLNLLLSTYHNSVLQNRDLLQAQHELRTLNGQLVAQRQQIDAQQQELREVNARLREQATRDSLTGLQNRRALMERLSAESDFARRHNNPFSLLLIDVDRFKQHNDSFGHPAGDEVLKGVAQLMMEQARVSDFVARYGGEEFVVLLPGTDEDASRVAGERLRLAIESATWEHRPVTVSIGIGTTSHVDVTTLMAQADTALYASKAAGRNRVTHSQDLSQTPPNASA